MYFDRASKNIKEKLTIREPSNNPSFSLRKVPLPKHTATRRLVHETHNFRNSLGRTATPLWARRETPTATLSARYVSSIAKIKITVRTIIKLHIYVI
jgi:hypothetical protein